MYDSDKYSRVNKFEKRRKNTKVITLLMIVGALLLIILVSSWLFGGKDKNQSEPSTGTPEIENDDDPSETNQTQESENSNNQTHNAINDNENNLGSEDHSNSADEADKENEGFENENNNEDVETSEVELPNDDNVESAYTGDWRSIDTEQSEPHETQFNEDTIDWKEMKQAIASAAELDADEMIVWHIGNDGEQKAMGTVSPNDNSKTYRVYISWITGEGWKPTQVEILKENEYDK